MQVHSDLRQLPTFKRSVITIGSFDGVHNGHLRIIKRMQEIAHVSGGETVVITFDPHPRAVLHAGDKHFKLLTSTTEKAEILQKSGIDHLVVVPFTAEFAAMTADAYLTQFLVNYFQPAHIVIGYDHRFGQNRTGDLRFLADHAAQYGYTVEEIPAHLIDDIAISSSKIRKALDQSDLHTARKLMGRPYRFSGTVVMGNQIGRTIGFPTANIAIHEPLKLVLPNGIYAARVRTQTGKWHRGMLYIGDRPTLPDVDHHRVIEVNLIDFNDDLYGQMLEVDVYAFIRPDQKLEGLEALKTQIESDRVAILNYLPDVAVVILNYNTVQHLETYLPSVTAYSDGARIIVADNGSPDHSLQFLRENYPQVDIIDLKVNYGFAQGYNEALAQVKADYYVILNSDVEVTMGWTDHILEVMQADPSIGVVQPKIMAWRDKSRFEYAGASGGWIDALGYPFCRGRIFSHSETDQGQYDAVQSCFWAAGAAFFIRAELYHQFGGFDGDYFAHNEEIDLCWRLKRGGYKILCVPQSTVYHLGGGTLEYENPRKVFLNFRNSLITLIKNEPAAKLLWLIPVRLLLDGVAGVKFLVSGQYKAIWAIIQAHFSLYGQIRKVLSKRRETARLVQQYRTGKQDKAGIYGGSIVFAHYIRRVKEFSTLFQ